MELTCSGCIHSPDFPGHIKCHSCARIYADHYENSHQDKIVKLQIFFNQFTAGNGRRQAISGGFHDEEFVCNKTNLKNLHPIDFPLTYTEEPTILQIGIRNPDDGMVLCASQKQIEPHICETRIKKYGWSISFNPSMEYIQHIIEGNIKE